MCQHADNVKKTIESYRKALRACHDAGVWPDAEPFYPRFFHTPEQKRLIAKLDDCQKNHRIAVENYANHVGPVPQSFFPSVDSRGYLVAPGGMSIAASRAFASVVFILALCVVVFAIAYPHLSEQAEKKDRESIKPASVSSSF